MTKKASILLLVLALVGVSLAGCGSSGGDVAKVGDVAITDTVFSERLAEFEKEYAGQIPDKETYPEEFKDFERSVLEYMVRLEIARQKAPSLGVSVTADQVQEQVDTIKEQSFGGDEYAFNEALAADGLTLDILKRNIEEQLLMQAVYEKVTESVEASDEEIQTYYDEHLSDYYQDETRTASHILIMPATDQSTTTTTASDATTTSTTAAPTEDDWAAAQAKAEQVRAEIEAGLSFADAAETYSEDPGSKDSGGELGDIAKGDTVTEFEDALFSMQVGEISQPVRTSYGYHLIKLEAINAATQKTLDEVKDSVSNIVLQENQAKAWEEWITQMKSELKVTYREGMERTTTTTAPATDATGTSTDATDASTSTTAGETTTTS